VCFRIGGEGAAGRRLAQRFREAQQRRDPLAQPEARIDFERRGEAGRGAANRDDRSDQCGDGDE
jgi:hypothetical protein